MAYVPDVRDVYGEDAMPPRSALDVPDIEPNPATVARWDRYPKAYGTHETLAAKQAYVDYVSLGPSRNLKSLSDLYQALPEADAHTAPTQSYATLRMWADKWQWDKRVEKILERELKDIERKDKERRREILQEGYALQIERVRGLKELAADIELRLGFADIVDSTDGVKVNLSARDRAALIGQLRGVLDDIAKEQGQRKPTPIEVTDADRRPIFNLQNPIPEPDWDEQT